jgi:sugar phosphate isomerase/epimerase
MRLGCCCYTAKTIDELQPLCAKLDEHRLSAIQVSAEALHAMSIDECAAYGQRAAELDILPGETGYWKNITDPRDTDEQRQARIDLLRDMLRKADAMNCRTVVTLAGSQDRSGHPIGPHRDNFTDVHRTALREFVLSVLDGLELRHTCYSIEPWHHTFFYQPEDIAAFLDSVDHPSLAVHMDQMNMVDQRSYFDTTALIARSFELLAGRIASVHLKDVRCVPDHLMLRYDEVMIGEGVMDYDTYLHHVAGLGEDIGCFTEHFKTEADYNRSTDLAHAAAERAGLGFKRRGAVGRR